MKRTRLTGSIHWFFRQFIPGAAAATVLLFPVSADAQLSRVGGTHVVYSSGSTIRGTATAHDPTNDLYLIVEGYGPVYGVFARPTGEAATAPFMIFDGSGAFGTFPMAKYSPDVNGGQGGFLVAWHQGMGVPNLVWGSIVAYDAAGGVGRVITPPRAISDTAERGSFWEGRPAIAYSITSKKFLVAWNTIEKGIRGAFVDTGGVPGAIMSLQPPGSSRDPSLAWNSGGDEFGLFYSGWNEVFTLVAFRTVSIGGLVSQPRQFGHTASGTYATGLDVNSQNEYVMVWALHPGTMSAHIDQQGNLSTAYVSGRIGYDLGLGFAFNGTTGTGLVVGNGDTLEIGAVETTDHGQPMPPFLVATDGAVIVGSFHPWAAARTGSNEWNISYARDYREVTSQIVTSSSVSDGCSVAPTANVPLSAFAGSPAVLTATAQVSPACGGAQPEFAWRFGDGTPDAAGQTQSHAYSLPGAYTWVLLVQAGSAVATRTGTIVITPPPPCVVDATATVPAVGMQGAPLTFAAAATASAGCFGAAPSFSWNFGDGSAASTAQNPTHAYAAAGTYSWTLTVQAGGATTTKTGTIVVLGSDCSPTSIVVAAQPPASLAAMWQGTGVTVTAGQAVTILASGGQTWTNAGQAWTADGNAADLVWGTNTPMPGAPRMALVGRIGTTGAPFLVGTRAQFTASAGGELFLAPNDDWYMLWDNGGSLTVSACAASATCTVSATTTVPTTAAPGAAVAFAATATVSAACGGAVPSFSWDFGDGSAASTAQNPTHTYAAAGTYSWTLTVQAGGATTTKTGTIVVAGSGCSPTSTIVVAQPPASLAAMWQGTGVTVTAGQAVTITVGGGQTWTNAGQAWTANGNAADPTGSYNSPMPGAPRMALVGRIGTTGAPFLVGAALAFTASAGGELFLAPNDDWYMLWDNAGSLTVATCTAGTACTVLATTTVPTTAAPGEAVAFAATATASAACGGAVPTFSWDFGDGSAVSTAQNPTHAYAAMGNYSWTLTVQAGGATTTKTGSILIASLHVVVAQPPTSPAAIWQGTGVTVTAGQVVTIAVGGSQTWTNAGQAWTANGNAADPTGLYNSPMPGAPRMALVGRVGASGTPFLVGTRVQFTASEGGELFLAPNDEWYLLWDNAGSLTVSVFK